MNTTSPFVLFTGGKGGVGKTNACALLARTLARRGRRLLAVDLDLGLANLHLALDVRPGVDLERYFAGKAPLRSCIAPGPDGVDLIAAGSGDPDLAHLGDDRRARLCADLAELAQEYDMVLADGAAGIGPDLIDFAQRAARVVVVTTPELSSLTDAYGTIKAMDHHAQAAPTPEVLINQADHIDHAHGCANRLRSACERFLARSPKEFGWLPRSRRLAEGGREMFRNRRTPTLERGALERMAEHLERSLPVVVHG